MNLFPDYGTALKICGITTAEDAEMLARLGVHALGANFFPKSKRYLRPEKAAKVLAPVQGKILRVGVFVNAPIVQILDLIEACLIDAAQLHGDEPPEDVIALKNRGIPVIKALPATELDKATDYPADAILIDTPAGKDYGGTGKTFDWSLAAAFKDTYPEAILLLAGGITSENAADAITAVHPTALDIASGAELSPGIKDKKKVAKLIAISQA